MGLNRQDKAAVIEEVAGIVANSSSIVIAEYRGLSVEAVTKLRAEARKNNVTLRVVKNTLVRRAVEGTEFAGLADQFVGPLVYGFCRQGSRQFRQGQRQARYQGRRDGQHRHGC